MSYADVPPPPLLSEAEAGAVAAMRKVFVGYSSGAGWKAPVAAPVAVGVSPQPPWPAPVPAPVPTNAVCPVRPTPCRCDACYPGLKNPRGAAQLYLGWITDDLKDGYNDSTAHLTAQKAAFRCRDDEDFLKALAALDAAAVLTQALRDVPHVDTCITKRLVGDIIAAVQAVYPADPPEAGEFSQALAEAFAAADYARLVWLFQAAERRPALLQALLSNKNFYTVLEIAVETSAFQPGVAGGARALASLAAQRVLRRLEVLRAELRFDVDSDSGEIFF